MTVRLEEAWNATVGRWTRTGYEEVAFTDLPDCGPTLSSGAQLNGPCDCPTRGDMNGDGEITAEDLSSVIAMVFESLVLREFNPACPARVRADVNCDGRVDMNDVEALGEFIFRQGPAPCPRCPSASAVSGSGTVPRR